MHSNLGIAPVCKTGQLRVFRDEFDVLILSFRRVIYVVFFLLG